MHDYFLKLTPVRYFECQKWFLKGMGAKSESVWILHISSGPHVNRIGHRRHLVFRNHKIPVVTSVRIMKLL